MVQNYFTTEKNLKRRVGKNWRWAASDEVAGGHMLVVNRRDSFRNTNGCILTGLNSEWKEFGPIS